MLVLAAQLIFASIATYRGHGWLPWMVAIITFSVGIVLAFAGVSLYSPLYFIIDISAMLYLIKLAFVPPEPTPVTS